MEAFLVSTFTSAIAEIGDKTQLLALVLAVRFKNKTAIILGMLFATILNHAIAGWLGHYFVNFLSPDTARYLVAASFLAMGLWVLIPDKPDAEDSRFYRLGPFLATFILFFIAEMGDKTQIATMVLAAKYNSLFLVISGTTLGILIANVPVVLAGHFSAEKLPLKLIHRACAVLFIVLALATLIW